MKRYVLHLAAIFLMTCAIARAQGGGAAPGTPAGPVAPGEEMKALAIAQLKLMSGNIVQLAKLMPADRLGWNPGMTSYTPPPADYASHDYGRTFANLCLHLSNLSFSAPPRWGAKPSPAFDTTIKNYEDFTTDRAKLVEQLTAAFAYAQGEVEKLTVADLNSRHKVGNRETTTSDILAIYIAGINDYFGQAKAYVHMQGVPGTDPAGFRAYDTKARK